ncbi:hypothetical protein F511_44720 [Dorcoceras hygrometricum]|uniref:Uncharacterized protein n=1 Tax=Dorcoceras hygrometricum TaxID=472368 RepID=A0A2Z6ZXN6_9LAMI|nr:hypothetical protein F511_44720 [Dorcoceras hygrometricum]
MEDMMTSAVLKFANGRYDDVSSTEICKWSNLVYRDRYLNSRIKPRLNTHLTLDSKTLTLKQAPPLLSSLKPSPPPPCAARLCRKIVSGQFDDENPFVLISSVLLVQADEGVSFLVVDRIGDIYRNLPRRADVIVTTVGARHKCQQDSVFEHPMYDDT